MANKMLTDENISYILQAMPEAVVIVDADGLIRYLNEKTEVLTGYSSAELIGNNVEILVPASRKSGHGRNVANYSAAASAREMGDRRGLGLRKKNGVIVPVSISLAPLANYSDSLVISTIRDVTTQERRSREEILLDEIGNLVAYEHETDSLFELLDSALPNLFEYDRLSIASAVLGTDMVERVFVAGHIDSVNHVGSRIHKKQLFPTSFGSRELRMPADLANGESADPLRVASYRMRSWVQVPLGDPDNPSGHIVIRSFSENAFTSDDVSLLERVASRISPAFENVRLYNQIRKEVQEKTALAEIGRAVSSSSDVAEFFDEFAKLAKRLIPFDAMIYSDIDIRAQKLAIRYWHGYDLPVLANYTGVELSDTIAAAAVDARKPVLLLTKFGKPVSDHANSPPIAPPNFDIEIQETICVPLTFRGEVFGCLYFASKEEGKLTDEHLKLTQLVADQVSGAISSARLQDANLKAERERVESESRSRELENLNNQRSDFLSSVSHELKTPLTSLVAFADILSKNPDDNLSSRQLDQIKVMRRSARRLDVLINDLVDVSQLNGGSMPVVVREFSVKELVDEILLSFEPVLEPLQQSSMVKILAPNATITGDRDRIAQLLSNLISNSSKYSPAGSNITVTISVDNDQVLIEVTDTGIGMDSETLEHVFTPFFRSDDEFTQSQVGTGLGLAIVKKIVELHDGEISAESEKGTGTTIRVVIPGAAISGVTPGG